MREATRVEEGRPMKPGVPRLAGGWIVVFAVALGALSGCAKKESATQTAPQESTGIAGKVGEAAGEAAGTAETLQTKLARGVHETVQRAQQGKELVEIRGALITDAALGAAGIDVTVDYKTHTVT